MHDGAPRLLHLSPSRDAAAAREGVFHYPMTCHSGGSLEIYVEPVLPKPQLLLVGDTPLVSGLARLGQLTGFAVWVADGGDHLRPPAADLYLPLADLRGRISAETYAVVATLGSDDEAALEQVVGAGPRYVGLVASRKRAEAVFAYLRERGVPADQLQRIKAPAGLDLGAVTPEEIALSIMAEIVQVRRRRAAAPGETVVRGEAAEAIDPVCGMTVAVATARHSALHQGVMFYFCSARCRQEFEHDPARFVPAVR
jgi:xanthine dehydrogenase accessory factor